MRRRASPRVIPAGSAAYWQCPAGRTWRDPIPPYRDLLVSRLADALARANGDPDTMLRAVHAWLLLGAFLGASWADPQQDLDTPRELLRRDPSAYGEAVLLELYDSGWTEADVAAMMRPMMTRLTARALPGPQEVAAQADFTAAPPAT